MQLVPKIKKNSSRRNILDRTEPEVRTLKHLFIST